jgi:hypothetical protein
MGMGQLFVITSAYKSKLPEEQSPYFDEDNNPTFDEELGKESYTTYM